MELISKFDGFEITFYLQPNGDLVDADGNVIAHYDTEGRQMLMMEIVDKFEDCNLIRDDICCINCSHLPECKREKEPGWALFYQFCNKFNPDMKKVMENRDDSVS